MTNPTALPPTAPPIPPGKLAFSAGEIAVFYEPLSVPNPSYAARIRAEDERDGFKPVR